MTPRFRLTPEAASRFPDLAQAIGTEELEPESRPGAIRVLWEHGAAGWFKTSDLEKV